MTLFILKQYFKLLGVYVSKYFTIFEKSINHFSSRNMQKNGIYIVFAILSFRA